MKKSQLLLIALIGALISTLALGCSNRQERSQPQRESNCTKATKQPDGWPMYAKRGGEGEIREKVAGNTKIDRLRTIEGWSLIRLDGTRRTGWVEESAVTQCPEKGARMAPREAPSKAAPEEATEAPATPAKASNDAAEASADATDEAAAESSNASEAEETEEENEGSEDSSENAAEASDE